MIVRTHAIATNANAVAFPPDERNVSSKVCFPPNPFSVAFITGVILAIFHVQFLRTVITKAHNKTCPP